MKYQKKEVPKEEPKKETPTQEAPKQETPKEEQKPKEETKQTEQSSQDKKDFSSEAASQLATNKEDVERLLIQLVEMGFPKEQAAKALRASFNNLSRAVEYLMSGEIPNNPLEGIGGSGLGAVQRTPASPSSGGSTSGGTASGTSGGSTPSSSGGSTTGGSTSGGTSASGGSNPINLWEAAQQQGEQQQQGGGGVFDFLRGNREFNTLRFMVQQNPQMLQPILQSLGQANPGLLQLITQNQEEFTRLLFEPVDPSQIAVPRQQTVQLNEEEKAALNRLMDLGFDQQAALEAYLTCEKNEELAANYLLEHAAEYMQDEGEGEGEFGEGGEGEGGDFGGNDN